MVDKHVGVDREWEEERPKKMKYWENDGMIGLGRKMEGYIGLYERT